VLRWARQTAGFDLPLAARRLQVKPEVIARWEEGLASPTIVQLRKAAAVYKRPLAVLLLPAPIRDPAPPTDFRVTEQRGEDTWTPALHAEFRRALSQRAVALEILDVWPESLFPSEYPIRIDLNTDPDTAAHAIRAALDADGVDLSRRQVEIEPRKRYLALAIDEHAGSAKRHAHMIAAAVSRALGEGQLSEGHARALLRLESAGEQRKLLKLILADGLSVRQAEAHAEQGKQRLTTRGHRASSAPSLASPIKPASLISQNSLRISASNWFPPEGPPSFSATPESPFKTYPNSPASPKCSTAA